MKKIIIGCVFVVVFIAFTYGSLLLLGPWIKSRFDVTVLHYAMGKVLSPDKTARMDLRVHYPSYDPEYRYYHVYVHWPSRKDFREIKPDKPIDLTKKFDVNYEWSEDSSMLTLTVDGITTIWHRDK